MGSGNERRDAVFTLRVWIEAGGQPGRWRARVTHLGSKEYRLFANYGDLCDFLVRWSQQCQRASATVTDRRGSSGVRARKPHRGSPEGGG